MKTPFKATLAALVMSSVAVGAIATTATIASVEPAFAKSDKASSKSESNRGKSENARGKSSERGKPSGRSAPSGKSGRSIEGFFEKLTGQDKRAFKAQNSAKPPKPRNTAKVGKFESESLHPNQLGNMNGALNANINAVLAHIRNGNGNGPVGHIATLAAASAAADGAQEVLDRAALFDAIEAAGYESLEAYYSALEDTPGDSINMDIEMAENRDEAAVEFGYRSYDDYLRLVEVPGADPDDGIDKALMNLGVKIDDRGDAPANLALDSSDPAVARAEETLLDETAAEKSILAYWNKNPGGDPDPDSGLTADEERLLTELRNRFSEADLVAIKETVDANSPEPSVEEDACEENNDLCQSEEEIVTLVD
jgi:hypothetical protein